MPPPANPDTRPLPSGWFQHYDPSRRSWYYVQTSVHPPKHSSTHPAELPGHGLLTTPRQSPQLLHNSSPPPQGPKLSAAQRLYASASLNTGGAILSVPGEGGDIPNVSRATPAPSLRSGPNPSVTGTSQQDGQHARALNSRTQSQGTIFTTATNPSNYYNTQRSSTYPSPYPSQTMFTSAPLGGNQPRHIVTKAQPPSLLLSESFGAGSTATLPSHRATPAENIGQGKALPASPPAPVNIPDAAPVTPPYVSHYPAEKKQPIVLQVRNQSISPTSATQQAKRASVAALKNVGKQFGAAAAKFVASGVGAALTGIDVATLASALTGTFFDNSGLQAVLQAQPNADYAAAIAALQQQQQQQASPTVDYALLINQIQQLQALALQQQQQQQQILAMQLAQLNQNHAIAAAQQQSLLGGHGGAAPPHTTSSPGSHQQSPPPFHAQGHTFNPSFPTNPPAPPGYQPQSPPYSPQTSPPHTQSPTPSLAATGSPQENLYQTLQAQQAAASQQMQSQIQQYQQASQAQQQSIMAQIQQQSQAIQIQQQAAIAQAVQQQQQAQQQQSQAIQIQQQAAIAQALQQQQQAQQQQNQAFLDSIVPPPAPGPSFADTMATYLNGALSGEQGDPAAMEIPPSYSGLMSSFGLGGDLSTLDLTSDLTSSLGGLDLSSMSSDALSSF